MVCLRVYDLEAKAKHSITTAFLRILRGLACLVDSLQNSRKFNFILRSSKQTFQQY